MGEGASRSKWQTGVLVVLFTGVITGVVYAFRENPLVQGVVFAILCAGVSVTARREETRRGTLARLLMGPFLFSVFLSTVADVDVALIPAVALWLLVIYYGFLDLISQDPLGVDDDRAEKP